MGLNAIVGTFMALGLFALAVGGLIFIDGIAQGWLFSNVYDTITVFMLLVFMAGPIIAVAGVHAWRRTDAERLSANRPRVMIVVGSRGIAGLVAAGGRWPRHRCRDRRLLDREI